MRRSTLPISGHPKFGSAPARALRLPGTPAFTTEPMGPTQVVVEVGRPPYRPARLVGRFRDHSTFPPLRPASKPILALDAAMARRAPVLIPYSSRRGDPAHRIDIIKKLDC